MYQDVQGSPHAGILPLVQSRAPIRSIEHAIMTLRRVYEEWRAQQAAIRELRGLDDHLLQDLGIERFDIPKIVATQVAANRR